MVAEKNGFIRFYDLISQRPIMSLSAGQVPLISADWCKTNGLKVGAVASDDWLIWDMSKSRYATRKTLYPWRVPIGTRHSFVNILWISMNFFHENCLVKIFSLKSWLTTPTSFYFPFWESCKWNARLVSHCTKSC